MATTGEIQAIWKILSANYVTHAKSLTPAQLEEQLQVWYAILADIPSDILRAAALQHMAGSKWFPQVAELRDLAAALLVERPASWWRTTWRLTSACWSTSTGCSANTHHF